MESADEILRLEMKTDPAVVESQARRAGLAPGMRTADMFCGSGITTAILSRIAAPAETVGVDASEERIEHARRTYAGGGASFVRRNSISSGSGSRWSISGMRPFPSSATCPRC